MPAAPRGQKRAFLHRRSIGRLLTATLAGVLTGILVTGNHGWAFRLVTGWDAGLLVLLGLAWNIILRYGPEETRLRAARVDPGRTLVWVVVVVASTGSLLAATAVVRFAKTLAPHASQALVMIAADDEVRPGYFEKSLRLLSRYPQAGACAAIADGGTTVRAEHAGCLLRL